MVNRIGTPLSRLVREIAYTKGALNAADRSLARLRGQIEKLGEQCRKIEAEKLVLHAQVAALEAKLQARTADITSDEIRGMRRVPQTLGLPHGALMAAIVSALKNAAGPLDTHAVLARVVADLRIPVGSPAGYAKTRRTIRRRLILLVEKGAVKRLPDQPVENRQVGVWLWKGL